MVEESESHTCAVWLIDEDGERCDLWMAYVKDRLFTPPKGDAAERAAATGRQRFPCESMAASSVRAHAGLEPDHRIPSATIRACPSRSATFSQQWTGIAMIATPLVLGSRTLGWMTVSSPRAIRAGQPSGGASCSSRRSRGRRRWRCTTAGSIELNRLEERRKAILEERNRLARDIHDNLAQGFARHPDAAAGRSARGRRRCRRRSRRSIETAVDLARTHLTEARRSVGALRPNVGSGEDIATALKRLADLGQRTDQRPDRRRRRRAAPLRRRRRARDRRRSRRKR